MRNSDAEVLAGVVRSLTGTLWSCFLKLREQFTEQELLELLPEDFPIHSLYEHEENRGIRRKSRTEKVGDLEGGDLMDEIHKSKSVDQIVSHIEVLPPRKDSSESPRFKKGSPRKSPRLFTGTGHPPESEQTIPLPPGLPSSSGTNNTSNASLLPVGGRAEIVPSLSLNSNAEPSKKSKGKHVFKENFPFVNKRKKADIHDGPTAHFLESRPDLLNYKKDMKNYPLVKIETSNVSFLLKGPAEDEHFNSGTTDDSVWACCLSSYPLKPSGQREGSPICDYFKVTDLDDRMVIVLCDGCNWGKHVREGAEKAAAKFQQHLLTQMTTVRTTHDLGQQLLIGLSKCHTALADFNSKKKTSNNATCTLLGGVLSRAHLSPRDVGWVFTGLNLGDCKAYLYSHKQRTFTDITASNRLGSKDASDPGGRIGSVTEDPDLRNLELIQTVCEPEDLLIFVSDGVHDNLDPELLDVAPSEIDLDEIGDKWSQLTPERAGALKENFAQMLIKKLLISELASTFLFASGDSDENISTKLPEPTTKDRRPRQFQPIDVCPPNFHFENTLRERTESSQGVHRSLSSEGPKQAAPDDIPYPAELSRPGTAQIGDSSLEDIFLTRGINPQDIFGDSNEVKKSPKPTITTITATSTVTSPLASSSALSLDCCNKWGPNVSASEEVTYLKGLSTRVVSSALVTHAARVTQSSRTFMETRSDRLPSNYHDYPGKMDHTTCITIRIPSWHQK